MATLVILTLGGRFVIAGSMTLGEFTAFNSYLVILVFPVIMIGFMSTIMAQASASYARIAGVLRRARPRGAGTLDAELRGDIALRDVDVELGGKSGAQGRVLRCAPPARGRRSSAPPPPARRSCSTCSTGLSAPTAGTVEYDGRPVAEYDPDDAAPAGRVRVPGQRHLQPEHPREHGVQPHRHRRRPREGDRDRRAQRLHRHAAAEARHRRLRTRQQPVGRPEAARSCWPARWR